MSAHSPSVKSADIGVLEQINSNTDSLLALCETDSELRNYSLKFKLDQAVDGAAFQAKRKEGEEILHFQRTLQRMMGLALSVALHILRRTTKFYVNSSTQKGRSEANVVENLAQEGGDINLQRKSSVVEFCDGSDAWLEVGANLSQKAAELLCNIIICHPEFVKPHQTHLLRNGILDYVAEALNISQDHEMMCFLSGFKKEHMRLLANLTFQNGEVCSAVVGSAPLLTATLKATRIDVENPGMAEWAQFVIRNLCCSSSRAREKIGGLTPLGIAEETRELFGDTIERFIGPGGTTAMDASHPREG
uniref:Ataxin-10 domain-containing protein n=1 Tax=Trypanosoma congolense (strain IL3000) TaxID=1068625 RepID=G0US68_TRYCI|nr:conserved hypothetical protein [Trypanosoma congolense IL3000]